MHHGHYHHHHCHGGYSSSYGNSNSNSGWALLVLLVGCGLLGLLGWGCFATGVAVGLYGAAAFFAGAGIVLGGLAVLTALSIGIYALAKFCRTKWREHHTSQLNFYLSQGSDNDVLLDKTSGTNFINAGLSRCDHAKPVGIITSASYDKEPSPTVWQLITGLFGSSDSADISLTNNYDVRSIRPRM